MGGSVRPLPPPWAPGYTIYVRGELIPQGVGARTQTLGLAVALSTSLLASQGCIDPRGDYEDFVARASAIPAPEAGAPDTGITGLPCSEVLSSGPSGTFFGACLTTASAGDATSAIYVVVQNDVVPSADGMTAQLTVTQTFLTLTTAGSGTVVLLGNNSFSGGLTLSAGTLDINNAGALGTGTFTISGVSTIDNTSGADITTSTNNNAQNWNANFTFTGSSSLNLGTGAVSLGASRTLTITANTLSVGGVISGSAKSITKAGAGTLLLSGNNTFSGGVTLSAGTLDINNAGALGTGTFRISAGTIDNTSGAAITLSNNNAQIGMAVLPLPAVLL